MSDHETEEATNDEQPATALSGTIFGTVTDEDGTRLEGVEITIVDESSGSTAATAVTGSTGDYSVTVADGTYTVAAEKREFEPAETTGVTISGNNEEVNFSLAARAYKTRGELSDTYGRGVLGRNTAGSGDPAGVAGLVPNAPTGTGVLGRHAARSGLGYGVRGVTDAYYTASGTTAKPTGVKGVAADTTGAAYGVHAVSNRVDGDGSALKVDANGDGVDGVRVNSSHVGVRISANDGGLLATGGFTGAQGFATETGGIGVEGRIQRSTGAGTGVFGVTFSGESFSEGVVGATRISGAGTGFAKGVRGTTRYTRGTGVLGEATRDTGVNYGVRGTTSSDDGFAVYADGEFRAVDDLAESGAGNLGRHVAQVRNTSDNSGSAIPDVLGLELPNVTDPTEFNSYISFMDSTGTIGNIQGDGAGGVEFTGTTADLAEFFPKRDPDRDFADGEVVGLVDGAAVPLDTEPDPDAVLVVSTAPLVTGNRPPGDRDRQEGHVRLSLVGQVPVRVTAPVESGDLLVASPAGDGTAVAAGEADTDRPVVGLALADHDPGEGDHEDDTGEVLALVGGPTPAAATTGRRPGDDVRAEIDAKDEQIADLEAELERKDARIADLEARLETVEDHLEIPVDGTERPASADD